MKFENDLICGIRPAILKKVFQSDGFDTLRLMRITGWGEPASSDALRYLAQEGWVSFNENRDGVDWWTTTAKAHRLNATRLIKRFPVKAGREIVERVIVEASRLNRDPQRSRRIVRIYLFGSVLTGEDDDLAGDIDLVVEVAERKLPADELKALERAELPERVNQMDFMERLSWPATSILRDLKKVSNKISLHQMHDLATLGVPYRQVYAFSTDRESEAPFDPDVRKGERRPEIDDEPVVVPPAKAVRPWPKMEDADAPVTLDTEAAGLAEHLWINGSDIEDIAARLRTEPPNVLGYLASRSRADAPAHLSFDAAFDRTIGPYVAIEERRSRLTSVLIDEWGRPSIDVDIYTHPEMHEIGGLRYVDKTRGMFHHVPVRLVPETERIARAALLWAERMQPKTSGLRLKAFAFYDPEHEQREPLGRPAMDFRPLRKPMLEVLDAMWPHPRGKYEGYEKYLEINISSASMSEIYYRSGPSHRPGYVRKRVRKAIAAPLRSVLDPLLQKWSDRLDGRTHYFLSVRGADLED